jgi:hypothetical protein
MWLNRARSPQNHSQLNYRGDAQDESPTEYEKVMTGGAEGIRTPDLLRAREALSQLSYSPKVNYCIKYYVIAKALSFLVYGITAILESS